jgi:hypothetical protein
MLSDLEWRYGAAVSGGSSAAERAYYARMSVLSPLAAAFTLAASVIKGVQGDVPVWAWMTLISGVVVAVLLGLVLPRGRAAAIWNPAGMSRAKVVTIAVTAGSLVVLVLLLAPGQRELNTFLVLAAATSLGVVVWIGNQVLLGRTARP